MCDVSDEGQVSEEQMSGCVGGKCSAFSCQHRRRPPWVASNLARIVGRSQPTHGIFARGTTAFAHRDRLVPTFDVDKNQDTPPSS